MEAKTVDRDFILDTLRANRDRLRTEFGIERIGLYGSFARNEQHDKSDIDLVYDLVKGQRLGLIERDRLQRWFSRHMYRNIDLVNQQYMNPFTRYTMREDVIYV